MNLTIRAGVSLILGGLVLPSGSTSAQEQPADALAGGQLVARFGFDGALDNPAGSPTGELGPGAAVFVDGLAGRALRLGPGEAAATLTIRGAPLPFDPSEDFSVQFWLRTTVGPRSRMVLLSQKVFEDDSLASQKQAGWVFYVADGTWAWNMGSSGRRITYERDNGARMPVNDGAWHQLTMTYDSGLSEVRLYYDGVDRVVYHVGDSTGFDFTSAQPLVVGRAGTEAAPQASIVPSIHAGATTLQELVDAFGALGVGEVEPEEFVDLIVEPRRLFDRKVRERTEALGAEGEAFVAAMRSADLGRVSRVESELMRNPYTVHQAFSFMEAAPLMKIYSLVDGEVTIDERVAESFSARERLSPTDFDIDELAVWGQVLSAEQVLASYRAHRDPVVADPAGERRSITVGVWNIFHGGKHFTTDEHGWDSRLAIAQILERENVDVVLMQETYSSGDFIAAELAYYFATTVDWDYLNQGANISVLSRYPIEEVYVPAGSSFMNVGARIAISETQGLYAMSNWYGMQQFSDVFDFHRQRFAESDTIPTVFGGDFNAVPHTDGGDSPASRALLADGFTDAFRSLYPDVGAHPGHTHRSGRRIDQLYYKGAALRNTSTRIVSTSVGEFPSDHYLILSTFELDAASGGRE